MHEAYTLAGIALYFGKWLIVAAAVGVLVAAVDLVLFRWPRLWGEQDWRRQHLRRDYSHRNYLHRDYFRG